MIHLPQSKQKNNATLLRPLPESHFLFKGNTSARTNHKDPRKESTATWEIKNLLYSTKICRKTWWEGLDVADLLVASICLKQDVVTRKRWLAHTC